jgi:hypothetical protein
VFPRITGKVTPHHLHFVKVLISTKFYTFEWKRYSYWETNNYYVVINPFLHCYSFLECTAMKAVLNAIKLLVLDCFSGDVWYSLQNFFLKMNFTVERYFVVRNVITVQVLDDSRCILHLYSDTYSTLMYTVLFIKISCSAIVNVICLILNTEWEWKVTSSEENCTLSRYIFLSFT